MLPLRSWRIRRSRDDRTGLWNWSIEQDRNTAIGCEHRLVVMPNAGYLDDLLIEFGRMPLFHIVEVGQPACKPVWSLRHCPAGAIDEMGVGVRVRLPQQVNDITRGISRFEQLGVLRGYV